MKAIKLQQIHGLMKIAQLSSSRIMNTDFMETMHLDNCIHLGNYTVGFMVPNLVLPLGTDIKLFQHKLVNILSSVSLNMCFKSSKNTVTD